MVYDKNRHITTATQLTLYLSQTPSDETENVSFASSTTNSNNNNNNSNSKFQSLCNLYLRPYIGEPSNLNNYLPDSEATKHMNLCLPDLVDVEQDNIRIQRQMAILQMLCYISVSMLEDNGSQLQKRLHDVTYVPGFCQRRFSITTHAPHGNFNALKKHAATLFLRKKSVTII